MTNPINPNYSGVTIQISNPSVYAGGQGLCPVQSAGVCAQAPQIPLQQNSGITSPIQPSYSYPPQYYLNNYNYSAVTNLAKSTFGIYLLHNPVRLLCSSYLPMDHLNEMVKIIILFAASLGISILILLPFILKWKKAGRILFYIK